MYPGSIPSCASSILLSLRMPHTLRLLFIGRKLMQIHPDHRHEAAPHLVMLSVLGLIALIFALAPAPGVALHANTYTWLHTALEAISISIAAVIFAVGWSAPRDHVPRIATLVASAFLGTALLDFSHTMTFQGMPGFFSNGNPENTVAFWLAARSLGVLALLVVALSPWSNKPFSHRYLTLALILAGVALVHAIVIYRPEWLPTLFSQEHGLTPFKRNYEYALMGLYLTAGILLLRHLRQARTFSAMSFIAAALTFALSELFFTLYASYSDIYHLTGHIYKVIAYLFLFRAIFLETIKAPYQKLQRSQVQLQHTLDNLSTMVTEKAHQDALIRKLSLAIEQSPNPVLITDRAGNIEYVNQAFTDSSGYESSEIIGRNPRFMQSGQTPRSTYESMWNKLQRGEVWQGEVVNRTKQGAHYHERVLIYPIKNAFGEITSYLSHKEDISEQKAAAERIRQLSQFDELTGLANQASLRAMLRHAIDLASHHNDALALMSINLDNFRLINESLGHNVGDLVLKSTADRLNRLLSHKDTLARVSGDHFVIIFPGLDQGAATLKALEILQTMQTPLDFQGHSAITTVSIGIALFPDDGKTADVMLACSEAAMYHTKNEGRNSYRFFTPGLQKSSSRMLELGVALKHAIPQQQLRLVYQPQIDLGSGRVIGAEALVRWRHPELGEIGPAEFIPIAEQYGLIVELGEWIMQTALKQATEWQKNGFDDLVIAINLSASQFNQPQLAETILEIVHEIDARPQQLELELTEAVAMRNPVAAGKIMDSLSNVGFRLSIDDFGTGYSSLSYLKRFNIHKLKIDRSFINDLNQNINDQAIVTAIIQMAHSLGMSTLAEGVETPEQLAVLRAKGCDAVQGYLFSKPLSPTDFEAFARANLDACQETEHG